MASKLFQGTKHASAYIKYRPTAPVTLVNHVLNYLEEQLPRASNGKWPCAVDVGCGSGQSSTILSGHFDSVTGTDVSQAQIKEAKVHSQAPNISYLLSPAETLPLASASVQYVHSGNAAHWFDMPKFYSEVDRILVQGGVVALFCHSVIEVADHPKAEPISNIILDFFWNKLGGCWDEGRKHVDNGYSDSSFTPLYPDSLRDESFFQQRLVSVDDIKGYLTTLSAYREYCRRHGEEKGSALLQQFLESVMSELEVSTPSSETFLQLRYPYFLIMARKK